MSGQQQTPRRPASATLLDIIGDMQVDDSSLAAIADAMKTHSSVHGLWIAYARACRAHLTKAELDLETRTAELVALYEKSAKSASAVANYAKYEVRLHPDIRDLTQRVAFLRDNMKFFSDMNGCMRSRADLLIAVSRLDEDAIVNTNKVNSMNMQMRDATRRFNQLVNQLSAPWGNEFI